MGYPIKPDAPDEENPEWTVEDFRRARAARVVLPEIYGQEVAAELSKPKRGRPLKAQIKEHINLRVSPDVISYFRATGPGWQTRMDQALKEWIAAHSNG